MPPWSSVFAKPGPTDGVGYFSNQADKLNNFQIILVDRSDTGAGNFDIYFNYTRIRWETGSASGGYAGLGGSSARAGYSEGTGEAGTSYEMAGSAVNGALLDGDVVLDRGRMRLDQHARHLAAHRSLTVGSQPNVQEGTQRGRHHCRPRLRIGRSSNSVSRRRSGARAIDLHANAMSAAAWTRSVAT